MSPSIGNRRSKWIKKANTGFSVLTMEASSESNKDTQIDTNILRAPLCNSVQRPSVFTKKILYGAFDPSS